MPCPCGGPGAYADCCGRYLDAGASPEWAEALMRSRYVAYVLGRTDYLLATWHPATRPAAPDLALDLDQESVRWLGLKIARVEAGGPQDGEGIVAFVARYKVGGRAHRLQETSRFVRQDGRWLYLTAVADD
ncbi:YchJ family metal-binding protein [Thiohalocapsa marina]|nr:YchJ family metal-binding protein [Thiohalocapsa marina]